MLMTAVPKAEPPAADGLWPVATPATIPFHLSPGWFDPWDASFLGADAVPVTVGGLAMVADRARIGPIGYRRLRSRTNVHTALFDYPPDEAIPADLAETLLAGQDVVTIDYVPHGSPLLAAARGWRGACSIAPHALAPLADCRAPYPAWLSRRSKRARQRWPALERKLTTDMGMTFQVHAGHAGRRDLRALLGAIFAVEQSGWKGHGSTAIRDDPRTERFYTDLAHRAAAADALRIATLSLDGRIVAFEYGVLGGDRLFLLKVGYDEAFEQHSIGHLLAVMHIRHCCGDPAIAWYDKMGNGMTPAAYKLRFNDSIDTLYRIRLYGSSWRGRLIRAHDAARAFAKRVRDRWRARRVPA